MSKAKSTATPTTDLNQVLSPVDFMQDIAECSEIRNQIPLLFENQAIEEASPMFYLTGPQISSEGLMRIVILDPTVNSVDAQGNPTSISVKLKLTGIMEVKTGHMIPQEAGAGGRPLANGCEWLRGFTLNPALLITPQTLAPEAWAPLVEYAARFKEMGPDAFYNENARDRLYLSPVADASVFWFNLQTRLDLSGKSTYSVGITSVAFHPGSFSVLGAGVRPATHVATPPARTAPAAPSPIKARQ